MILEVTDNVFRKINELVAKEISTVPILRVSVEGGGCFGFKYKFELVNNIEKEDHTVTQGNTKVIIDPCSLNFIKGCKIDYVEELGNSEFQIVNPNATSTCGCNNSFTL